MADLAAVETAREEEVTGKTHADQAREWSRWENYCGSFGIIEDEFLDHFTRGQRIRIMGDFAMAIREGVFSGRSHGNLAESKIRGAISYVSHNFRGNYRPNPTKDKDGEPERVLSRQYRAYKNSKPNPKQQKSIPICIVAEVFNS